MLPLEHSAILLSCIKRYSVMKTIFGLFESGGFTQVLLYCKITMKSCAGSRNHSSFLCDFGLLTFFIETRLVDFVVWLYQLCNLKNHFRYFYET